MIYISTFLTLLAAIFIFGILIFVHEMGHFIAAKATHTGVNEFSIGMGPKILYFQGKNTLYSLRAFPVGGFVRLKSLEENPEATDAFEQKNALVRIFILISGALMNILFALLISVIMTSGEPYLIENVVSDFHETNVSSSYGLEVGDEILQINGKKIYSSSDIVYSLSYSGGKPVDITVRRNGETTVLEDVSFVEFEEEGIKGFTPDFYLTAQNKTFTGVIKQGVFECYAACRSVWDTFALLFGGEIGMSAMSGPIGTTAAISSAVSYGIRSAMYITMLLGVNLGIVNLFPLPVLDGGKIVITLIEAVIRRKINPKIENAITLISVAILLFIMIFVSFNDIMRFR